MWLKKEGKNKRAQVTIFVIIALFIVVAGIISYHYITPHIPNQFKPIEGTFKQCINEKTVDGLMTLGLQAGYINMPKQSSESVIPNVVGNAIDFSGIRMPFWFYMSGDIMKKQVPTKKSIESDLNEFIKQNIDKCVSIIEQKYESVRITKSDKQADVSTNIYNDHVDVNVRYKLLITKGNKKIVIRNHRVNVKSKFGQLYNDALKLLDYELESMFLENYSIDVLRLYLPVDGFKLTCKPLTWSEQQLASDFQNSLLNLKYIRFSGKQDYFKVPVSVASNVDIMPLTASLKAYPSENGVVRFDPVGNQAGLGAAGFCYTPYHIVYDVYIPVVIQLFSGGEIFQFPLIVTIKHNQPRVNKALENETIQESEICNHKVNSLHVETYHNEEPVNASVYVKCLNVNCYIGKTKNGIFESKVPSCINSLIKVSADGFATSSLFTDTNKNLSITFYLDKLYNETISTDTSDDENVIIYFNSNDFSKAVYYPSQKELTLKPGHYNITAYVFKRSSINIPNTSDCVNVDSVKQCFNIQSQGQMNYVIIGGGKKDMWINEQELNKGHIRLEIKKYKEPTTVDEIDEAMQLVENSQLNIEFS